MALLRQQVVRGEPADSYGWDAGDFVMRSGELYQIMSVRHTRNIPFWNLK